MRWASHLELIMSFFAISGRLSNLSSLKNWEEMNVFNVYTWFDVFKTFHLNTWVFKRPQYSLSQTKERKWIYIELVGTFHLFFGVISGSFFEKKLVSREVFLSFFFSSLFCWRNSISNWTSPKYWISRLVRLHWWSVTFTLFFFHWNKV